MVNLPSGTVTFLFTDIEGSTKLAQEHPDKWESLRTRHHEILKSAIGTNNGYIFQIIGDAVCAAFHTAGDAVRSAVRSQIELHREDWGDTPIKVRMGINTGTAHASPDLDRSGGYKGYTAMARVQRLMSAAHGGQVLISLATEELIRDDLPNNVTLHDMGECRLKDLIHPEHIHQLAIKDLPSDFPPLKTLDIYRHNLPVQLTSFIGRENEITEIAKRIRVTRLVTLTGIGGTGKTRLGLQVAANMIDEFPDGVWFIELASIAEPDLIPQTILTGMGVPEQSRITNINFLTDYLQRKKVLLIFDNCEHLIEACARVAQRLVKDAAIIRILSTSREALGIQGELIWQVQSLSLPDAEQPPAYQEAERYESVQLFIERARLAQPQFLMTKDNASDIVRICLRLDGIPLAIELAAARVRSMSVDEIAKRLEDRFRLLMGGNRSGLERHQTLRATITWSYNLLSSEEKILLCRLSVFSGGWTLEAAEQVCSENSSDFDVLDILTRLVEKSLANLDGSRYRMLETTRQYALEKLLESDDGSDMHTRHAAFFLEFARRGSKHFDGPDHIAWTDRFDKEIDNFRSALDWCIAEQNTESALNLLVSLGSGWNWKGYGNELEDWLNKVRSLPNVTSYPASYAGLLNIMGKQFRASINISKNIAYLEEAKEIWIKLGKEGEIGLARALQILGEIALHNEKEKNIAQSLFERSYELFQIHDDKQGIAWSILHFGSLDHVQGRFKEAEKKHMISLAKFQELGNKGATAFVLSGLGELMRDTGNYDRAENYWGQNLGIFREIHNRSGLVYPLSALGWISLRKGEHDKAKKLFAEALGLSREYGNNNILIYCVSGLAGVLGSTGKPEQAAKLFSAVDVLGESMGKWEPADKNDLDHYLEVVRKQLDQSVFDKAWAGGRTLKLEQAVEFVLEQFDE